MIKKIIKGILVVAVIIIAVIAVLLYALTYHPGDVQEEKVACRGDVPDLEPGQTIKVLSWNVQFMAGKNYVFFFDLLDDSGPDERPSKEDIAATFSEVARIITDEDTDIIHLQEVDQGADRTDNEDQLQRLLALLPDSYRCSVSSFYWKASFVPHPRIMGSAGLKLATISKYKITKAVRHQLELIPADIVTRQFNLKRAVLSVSLPVKGGKDLEALNTHLDAFAQGTGTMEKQVAQVSAILKTLDGAKRPWFIGGDFNLLPPGKMYGLLPKKQQAYFLEKTELKKLTDRYKSFPSVKEANGPDFQKWFTHFPNDPDVKGPDRIIDYIFMSDTISPGRHLVRRKDTLGISDHFPLVMEAVIPK